jgi:hypothetical protein
MEVNNARHLLPLTVILNRLEMRTLEFVALEALKFNVSALVASFFNYELLWTKICCLIGKSRWSNDSLPQ